ncbi:hypothetical protein AURDEDRAFT_187623, partial [Auricularia subglabra TFB-10046 SS5]
MANKKRSKQKKAGAAQCGANDHPKAAADASDAAADETQLLPRTVLVRVLDRSLRPAVIAVAGVCRSWRAVAREHNLFYAYIALDGDELGSDKEFVEKSLDFSRTLADARDVFERVSVSITSRLDDNGGLKTDGFKAEVCALMAVRRELEHICALDLLLVDRCCTIFHGFLHEAPAPRLEELRVAFSGDDGPGPFAPLPGDLFKGSAPLLQKVQLDGVLLTAKPVAAFARVQEVELFHYSSEQLPFVAPNFLGMARLKLDFLDLDYDERYPGLSTKAAPLTVRGATLT